MYANQVTRRRRLLLPLQQQLMRVSKGK